jgi:hypothetical protein
MASVASDPINFFRNNLNLTFPSTYRFSEQCVNFNFDLFIILYIQCLVQPTGICNSSQSTWATPTHTCRMSDPRPHSKETELFLLWKFGKCQHSGSSPRSYASAHAATGNPAEVASAGQQWPHLATVRTRHETRPVSLSIRRVQFIVGCVPTNNQCKTTTNNLLMWGRYPSIDTSPIEV